jgi:hypothetical protein
LAQRRVDLFRGAVEAGNSDAIDGMTAAVQGTILKSPPWDWMVSRERDEESCGALRDEIPDVDGNLRALIDYLIKIAATEKRRTAALRAGVAYRDDDAIRFHVSYMRAVLRSNAQHWVRKKGIRLTLRD